MDKTEKTANYFDLYKQYSSTLRNWFVAFGVGGVALFVSHAEAFSKCSCGQKLRISITFSIAVFFQILIAFVNKYVNFYLNEAQEEPRERGKCYKIARTVSDQIWMDMTADVIFYCRFSLGSSGINLDDRAFLMK